MSKIKLRRAAALIAAVLITGCEQEISEISLDEAVSTPVKTGIRIKSSPDIFVYALNQPYSADGLKIEYVWSNGSTTACDSEYALSPAWVDTSIAGPKRITVTAGKFSTKYAVMVNNTDKMLTSISITPPQKTRYEFGEALNTDDIVVTGHYSDGTTKNEAVYYFTSIYEKTFRGTQTVTVRVNSFTVDFNVETYIPASAVVTVNGCPPGRIDSTTADYQQIYRKGQTTDDLPERLKVTVTANGVTGYLTRERGISPQDITGFSGVTAAPGSYYPQLNLDEKTVSLSIYVLDANPELFFDYGYSRHEGNPDGKAPDNVGCYTVPQNRPLVITPVLFLINDPAYFWTADGGLNAQTSADGLSYSAAMTGKYLKVTPMAVGTYNVSVTAGGKTASTTIVCTQALPAAPPNTKPPDGTIKNFAPGQFSAGGSGYGWSLGAQGGYEIWTLRRVNDGTRNIQIYGNPMSSWSEPGIVWVSIDANGNNYPDDTWYELKGSEDEHPTRRDLITREYAVRYMKSGEDEYINEFGQPVAGVFWVDGKGRAGKMRGGWMTAATGAINGNWAVFTGTLLQDDGKMNAAAYDGIITDCFGLGGWGYVDAAVTVGGFSIADAVQRDGSPANLPWIDFVKVQTAVFCYGGAFGEVSTEIKSADGLGSQTDFPSP